NWDKVESTGRDVQYFKLYDWDGKSLKHKFSIDFVAAGLGSPHQMRFGSYALYGLQRPAEVSVAR
ncbi:MAG: selenium-binding protein, partial [Gammaproteobacteria bacterium]|nr:selenium-binding protein [Gammaproteobacteria bacterium]